MVKIKSNFGKIRSWINTRIRIPNENTFVGRNAGDVSTGNYNTHIGFNAGRSNVSGYCSTHLGHSAGFNNIGGYSNSFFGNYAGFSNTEGYSNCFVGYCAGYFNLIGERNVFLGHRAGNYETGDDKFFVDSRPRTDEADGRIKALLYGVFDAATANQRLSINAQLLVREVTTYVNDAAAGSGGLVTGELYKHADGSVHIKL